MNTPETTDSRTSVPVGVVAFMSASEVLDFAAQGIITTKEARLLMGLDAATLTVTEKAA